MKPGWFSIELGINVEGQRYSLLNVLDSLLTMLPGGNILEALDRFSVDGKILVPMPGGSHVALPVERVKAIVGVLIELFEAGAGDGCSDGQVSMAQVLSLLRAVLKLEPTWAKGAERLKRIYERLRGLDGVAPVQPAAGLNTQLRDYQLEGLSWLQFLREFELGGVLADDMGLGKTVQILAHILLEKEHVRLTRPCLVVCPTSVIPNWIPEATRFAPLLCLIRLHG